MANSYKKTKTLQIDTALFKDLCRYFSYFSGKLANGVYNNRRSDLEVSLDVLDYFVGDFSPSSDYGTTLIALNPPDKEEMLVLREKISLGLTRKLCKISERENYRKKNMADFENLQE